MSKHRPERFKEYFELPDKTGFKINGTDYVFKYDQDGGWRDEDGNYYDCNGEPVYSDASDDDDDGYKSYDGREWSDYDDEYEKEYGPSSKVIEEF